MTQLPPSAAPVLEPASCPLCGSDLPEPVMRGPDRAHGVPGTFAIVRCRACKMLYQSPRPSAASFSVIYPPDYGPYQAEDPTAEQMHPDLRRACQLVLGLQSHVEQPRLLDIGCGPGRFLQAMRLLAPGWELAGIEPDAQAAAHAQAAGLHVLHGRAEQIELPRESWDAITLWNVIEHLPDPLAMMRRAEALLRPNGVLYLAVPLHDSWDARLFGQFWTGWELPRHFSIFDRASLDRMLRATGFQRIAARCIDGRSYGFTASLRLMLQAKVRSFGLRRLAEALTYSRPLALAISPYTALAVAARRCTVLTIAARRIGSAPAR